MKGLDPKHGLGLVWNCQSFHFFNYLCNVSFFVFASYFFLHCCFFLVLKLYL